MFAKQQNLRGLEAYVPANLNLEQGPYLCIGLATKARVSACMKVSVRVSNGIESTPNPEHDS
jgi:hypothetical protein